MNVFSQCEYLKAIIMYALNSHPKLEALARASQPAKLVSSSYENDSIIFILLLLNQHGKISTSSHKKGLNLIPTQSEKKVGKMDFFPFYFCMRLSTE